jgi:signal transduction histidine kinase
VILVGVSLSTFYAIAKTNLVKAIYAHLRTTAQSRAYHIKTFLEEDKNRLKLLAESGHIEDTVKDIIRNIPYSKEFQEDLSLILKDFAKAENETYELFILNLDGKIIASTNEENIGADKSSDAYFLAGKEGTYIKDAYYSETTRKETYAVSTPIRDDNTKELLGVLVGRFGMIDLNEITTERTGLGETGELYIVNKYGYMITPSRFKDDTFLKQKVDTENFRMSMTTHPETHFEHSPIIYPDYRGISVLGTHDYIAEMQWSLLAEIDEKEAMAPLAAMKLIFIIIFCTIPAVVWTVGILVSRAITAPIHRLHRGTEIIGDGDLDYKVGTDTKDEIGQLSRAFDKMTNDLKGSTTSIDNLNKEIAVRKQAEEATAQAYIKLEDANKELKETQSQLVQNEKLASIGQLAAGIAHEINTPVGFVASNFQTLESYIDKIEEMLKMYDKLIVEIEASGKTELLNQTHAITKSRGDMKIDFILEDIQELFSDSKEGVARITNIVRSLRDFSRIDQPGSLDEYDFNDGIKATLVVAKNEIKYDANVKTDFSEVPSILCHAGQINQVFLNVLINAAQAIKSRHGDDMGAITIKTYATDDQVVCEISDNGGGIAPENLSKVFDPFFTTKPTGKGTGLGLSVSYDIIVHKNNGQLLVDSTVGEGTTFTIKLPIENQNLTTEEEIISNGKKNDIICG